MLASLLLGRNLTKLKFYFEQVEKKFTPIDEELKHILPHELLLGSQKYGLGIPDPKNNYPVSYMYIRTRVKKSTGSRQCCGTGTINNNKSGTVSGTVIKWDHKSYHRHTTKLCI